MREISEKTRCSIDDVTYAIGLISFIMPLDWTKDKEYLKRILPNQKYMVLENILQDVHSNFQKDSLFLSEEDSKFVVKPDLLADFLRSEYFRKYRTGEILEQLIESMPYRLATNMVAAMKYDKQILEDVCYFLIKIWHQLNKKKGETSEYIFAIYLFLTEFKDIIIPSSDLQQLNIK
jgi:hypothetical protein